jgi:hypothetical protein
LWETAAPSNLHRALGIIQLLCKKALNRRKLCKKNAKSTACQQFLAIAMSNQPSAPTVEMVCTKISIRAFVPKATKAGETLRFSSIMALSPRQKQKGVTIYYILPTGLNNVKTKVTAGQTIILKEFRSTSRSKTVAKNFQKGNAKGLLLVFKSWNVGADISALSPWPEEEETLLAPYQAFTVTEVQGNIIYLDADMSSIFGGLKV